MTAQPPKMGTLLVKTARGISAEQTKGAIARAGGMWQKSIAKLDLHVVLAPEAALDAIAKNLKGDAAFTRVELNRPRKARALPADPLYTDQWALPQIAWDSVYGVAAPVSWTKVAILDTGVDGNHADLVGALAPGTSFLDDSNGLTDGNGHGTGLAGIVAARTNNGAGMAGVGYDFVQVMPVKVLSADGTGYDAEIIQGVLYAADAGAGVILMAFSGPGYSESLQEAIDYAWARGAVLVAAAGNDGSSTPTYPAGDRGVMGVAGTDTSDALAGGSNSGPAVFIAAPGVNVLGTNAGGGYTAWNGTSAAAAIVAGSAALLRAIDPAATNGMIVNRLAKNAEAAGTQEQTGNGRVQLARAAADTTTDSIQPAGAAPLGSGGPFVGPYKAAATTVAINGTANSPQIFTADAAGDASVPVGYSFTVGVTGDTTGFKYTLNLVNGGTSLLLASSTTCLSPGTYTGSVTKTLGGAASNTQTWTLRVATERCGGTGSGGNAQQSDWVIVNPPAPPGGSIGSITVGTQTGTVTYGTAATPTYAVSATRGSNGTVTGNYAVSGLPAGVTGAFNPVACDATGGNPIPSTTLTLTVGTSVPANSYSFTVSCANASSSGTLTVQKATPTATLAVSNSPQSYTGLAQAATVSISSSSVSGAVANILTGGSATKTNAGSYTVTADFVPADTSNYNTLTGLNAGSFVIQQVGLSVNATASNKVYGASDPAFSWTYSGFVSGENSSNVTITGSASCSRTTGETVGGSPYTITCAPGTLASTNYSFATGTTAEFNITKAPLTVNAVTASKVYGGTDPTFTWTYSGFISGENSSNVTITGSASCTRTSGESVATSPYTITCTAGTLSAANYSFATGATAQFSITKAPLTVNAVASGKVYGTTDPAFTWTYSGFISGEDSGNVTINGSASCSRTPGENVTTYTITCGAGTLSATNYSFSTGNSANFIISKRPVTASIIAANKEFDNTKTAVITSCSLNAASGSTGVIAGDVGNVTCLATNGMFASELPGTWTVTANVALNGSASGNYELTSSAAATTATISVNDNAVTRYIGQTLFMTSGTNSTTAQVALTASITDPTGLALVGAKVTFIDISSGKVLAKDVPVAAIPGGPASSGTANTMVTLSSGQYGSESYVILVKLVGNYDNSGQDVSEKTATVVVTQPAAANTIRGGGTIIDTEATTVAGTYASAAASTYSVGLAFNNKGTNLVGQIKITIPQADGSEIVVKSNSLSTMAVATVTGGKTATVYAKASIYRSNPDLTLTAIDGNVTLRLDAVDMDDDTKDGIGFTVLSSKGSTLYFSNDWYFDAMTKTWKTRTQTLTTGTIDIGG